MLVLHKSQFEFQFTVNIAVPSAAILPLNCNHSITFVVGLHLILYKLQLCEV